MFSILGDLRFALRWLTNNPGFSVVAILTLALGVGVNSTVFSLINAFMFRPLPVGDPHQLVVLGTLDHHIDLPHYLSYLDYLTLRERADVFTGVVGYQNTGLSMTADGRTDLMVAELVTGNFFSMLGVGPALGRTFTAEERWTPGADPVFVISYGFWQSRFGGDPAVVGKAVQLNGHPFTIIGVAPERFPGAEVFLETRACVPLTMVETLSPASAGLLTERDHHSVRVMARLRPGVDLKQASSAITVIARQLEQEYPATNKDVRFVLAPETRARPEMGASSLLPPAAAIFMALVGLVLLITCANVSNLLLARAAGRIREMGIRAALGARRRHVAQQVLAESLLLGLAGGVAGLLLTFWLTDWLSGIRIPGAPIRFDLTPDARVILFSAVAGLGAGLLAGMAPVLQSSRSSLLTSLREGTAAPARMRLRSVLVVAQIAISLMLLMGAALFVDIARGAAGLDLGFRTENLLLTSFDLELNGYDETRGRAFQDSLLERARSLPGVRAAALSWLFPFSTRGTRTMDVVVEGAPAVSSSEAVGLAYNVVGLDYFRTMGIPIRRGRDFTSRDDASSPRVAIVSESTAARFWPGEDAVGRRFRESREGPLIEVVGVAHDVPWRTVVDTRPFLYLPLSQNYRSGVTLQLCTDGNPLHLAAPVRAAIEALDREVAPYEMLDIREHLRSGLAFGPLRLGASLATGAGLLGLAVALVGLYGVVAFAVSQRTRELGVRMALGADARDLLHMVLAQGMRLTAYGLGIGLLAGWPLSRAVGSFVIGDNRIDPWLLLLAALLLALVAAVACYVPARRAAHVDPLVALRYD